METPRSRPDIPAEDPSGHFFRLPFGLALWIILALIIFAGIWARFTGLAWHFTHIDDLGAAKSIIDEKLRGDFFPFSSVPLFWTYAPVQFFFTKLLLHPGLTYRDILFWGRLPSAAFGSAGLLAMVWFYRLYDKERISKVCIASAILAFSWEALIHAKQMHNYALGVTSSILLLVLLMTHLSAGAPVYKRLLFTGAAAAFLSACHYQILFFIPGFYGVLLLNGIKKAKKRRLFVFQWLSSAAVFTAAFFPVWFYFFHKQAQTSIPGWNMGPAGEFLLLFKEEWGLWERFSHIVSFSLRNLIITLQSNTSFLPEDHFLFELVVYYLFTGLFMVGILSYVMTKNEKKRYLALYWLAFGAVWIWLLLLKKITFSPTRHSLVLLPFMAVTIAEGFAFTADRLGASAKALRLERGAAAIFSLAALLLFLFNYGTFLEERKDPFDEEETARIIREYDAGMLMRVEHTLQPVFMRSVTEHFGFWEEGWPSHELFVRRGAKDGNLVWISHRWKLNEANFEKARTQLNTFIIASNVNRYLTGRKSLPVIEPHFGDYEVIYSQEKESEVQIDYSRRTRNGSNNLYIYVLREKPRVRPAVESARAG